MPLETLLYVSKSQLEESEARSAVEAIVDGSVRKNPSLQITGALLFTGTHFAQILEGPADALDALMNAICADNRHSDVEIVERAAAVDRRFASWGMAYCGPSQFVSRRVLRLFNNPSQSERVRASMWLTEMLEEFTRV